MKLLTASEMRALDCATIERGTPGATLMERAGAGVVGAMVARYGSLLGLRVLVLCGTGNNGGDGFVAARHLDAHGAEVHVGVLGDRGRVTGDAAIQLAKLAALAIPGAAATDEGRLREMVARSDAWDFALDALLGTGAHGEPEGVLAAGVQVLRELDERGTRVVAVDLPTGIDADTGGIARRAVRADLTVTFGMPKRGHLLYPGRAFVGVLEVVDIGIDAQAIAAADLKVTIPDRAEMAALVPTRDPRAHKTSTGRVLVVGGSVGLTGAVALAARGALRTGAGYVQAAVPAGLNDVLEMKLTEEMTLPMPETAARALSLAAYQPILARAADAGAVALGSGLSSDPDAAALARRLFADAPCPLVLDADGLNAFAQDREQLALPARAPRVLTPHLGEMERLTGIPAAELEARRIDAAGEWARRWGCVLVLKGAPTVVGFPDGRSSVNPTGNPVLATAGTGDVLTGMIAALIAQGASPADAARLGVYVHGMAGDRLAALRGGLGISAGDVIEALPGVLQKVRAGGA
jgi:NAD(P)H-hydrate epimerase